MASLDALHGEIIAKLKAEYQFKENARYLHSGICPTCGRKDLYTSAKKPYYIVCNHRDSCQYESNIRELMPEFFENLNERYPATDEDSNATAKAYLSLKRGFPVEKMAGWFEQGAFSRSNGNRSTQTVRFFLSEDRKLWWERFIEPVDLRQADGTVETRDCNFPKGEDRTGIWWMPPALEIAEGDTVYLCEGILKAIPFLLADKKAVSIMASGSFPHKSIKPHLGKKVRWVWALDSDAAGRKATVTHHHELLGMGELSSAIFSTEYEKKLDWDDMAVTWADFDHIKELESTYPKTATQVSELKKLNAKFPFSESAFKRYHYFGDLELVDSYARKGFLIYNHRQDSMQDGLESSAYFCYEFGKQTFSADVNKQAFDKQVATLNVDRPESEGDANNYDAFMSSTDIKKIATCKFSFLYYQQPIYSDEGDYFFRLEVVNGVTKLVTFKNLAKASSFKERCQLAPGANFMGGDNALSWLYNRWMSYKPPVVKVINYAGYVAELDAYILGDLAIQSGKIIKRNKNDFFPLKKGGIKSVSDFDFSLNKTVDFCWVNDFKAAFKNYGLIVLAWWICTIYIGQIKEKYKDFPYFALLGTSNSGKTRMVHFLWKLTGLDGRKMPVTPGTLVAFYRQLLRFSAIPAVINELENEEYKDQARVQKKKQVELNDLKKLYDGEPLYARGRADGGSNNVDNPVFKSNLMLVQNVEISDVSESMVTRFCRLWMDTKHHDDKGRAASDRLDALTIEQVSGFLVHLCVNAKKFLAEYDANMQRAKNMITTTGGDWIKNSRVKTTHAQLLAMIYTLPSILPGISDEDIFDLEEDVLRMAVERQRTIDGDNGVVKRFWEQFDYLDSQFVEMNGKVNKDLMNHIAVSKRDRFIAVHIPTFYKACKESNLPIPDVDELHKYLPTSKERRFIETKRIESSITRITTLCYIFEKPK